MTNAERNVYQAIAEQYMAQFMPHKHYLSTKASFVVNGHAFSATATKVTQEGWTTLLSSVADTKDEDSGEAGSNTHQSFEALQALISGESGHCHEVTVSQEKTKPQPLYAEATLLKDLRILSYHFCDIRALPSS